MAATLVEISTSKIKNRQFWNGQIKHYCALVRQSKQFYMAPFFPSVEKLNLMIKKALISRKNYEYLCPVSKDRVHINHK